VNKRTTNDNDEGRAIYGNLENKINTLYWPVENSISKNNDRRCANLGRVENEKHFLMECNLYDDLRYNLFFEI
jgi:hypothetical protein